MHDSHEAVCGWLGSNVCAGELAINEVLDERRLANAVLAQQQNLQDMQNKEIHKKIKRHTSNQVATLLSEIKGEFCGAVKKNKQKKKNKPMHLRFGVKVCV